MNSLLARLSHDFRPGDDLDCVQGQVARELEIPPEWITVTLHEEANALGLDVWVPLGASS